MKSLLMIVIMLCLSVHANADTFNRLTCKRVDGVQPNKYLIKVSIVKEPETNSITLSAEECFGVMDGISCIDEPTHLVTERVNQIGGRSFLGEKTVFVEGHFFLLDSEKRSLRDQTLVCY